MAVAESGGGLALSAITKYGWLKFASFGFAMLGAGMMAAFRPPKSRRELFLQGIVALGSSLLLGNTVSNIIAYYFNFINIYTSPVTDVVEFYATVHGLIGAFSWGLFGGIAALRDRFAADPLQTVKDVRSL